MGINANNQNDTKKNGMLIFGFVLLFTPFSIIGVFILVGYFITKAMKNNDEKTSNNNKPNTTQPSTSNPSEYNEDIKTLNPSTNKYNPDISDKNYEQEAKALIVDSSSTKCDICRAINDKGTKYCKYCGELLGKGKKCGFCGTKNELSLHYCKNCGVRFK